MRETKKRISDVAERQRGAKNASESLIFSQITVFCHNEKYDDLLTLKTKDCEVDLIRVYDTSWHGLSAPNNAAACTAADRLFQSGFSICQ